MFFFLLLIIISISLEGTVTTLPITMVFLLCLSLIRRDWTVFPIAFFAGLLLDLLRVQTVGVSSLFFMIFTFLILLYQRKYEINSYPFVVVATFLGSIIYFFIFGLKHFIIQSILISIIAALLFAIIKFFFTKNKS